jgi:predicted XRE-type DNA-binding protein
MIENEEIIESSGNVFADLGLPNPEERLAKAELARQIRRIIAERDLTQAQAGAVLGLAQPNVSNLLNGRLKGFSVEKMMEYLTALNCNVQIVVTPMGDGQERGEITVTTRSQRRPMHPVRSTTVARGKVADRHA